MTSTFNGFLNKEDSPIEIPELFFSKYLTNVSSLDELKLCLYLFWHQNKMGEDFNGITIGEILEDELFSSSLTIQDNDSFAILKTAIANLLSINGIKEQPFDNNEQTTYYYFINNAKGIKSSKALSSGKWAPGHQENFPIHLVMVAPNIFKLYEENIGPITPLLSELLTEAENDYPTEWIEDAFKIGIENNVRNWKYIEAVLKRWKAEGKHERTNQENAKEGGRKYSEGADGEFFEN